MSAVPGPGGRRRSPLYSVRTDMSGIPDILICVAAPTPDVFAVLANPVRRRVLELFGPGPRPSGEITAASM